MVVMGYKIIRNDDSTLNKIQSDVAGMVWV